MTSKEEKGLSGAEQLVAAGAMVLKAENDRMEAIAIARPRDEAKVKERAKALIEADPEAAASAFYSIPFKEHSRKGNCTGNSDDECPVKEWVEGIGIEGAREIARLWGNNSSRVYISDEDDEWVYLAGVFLDLETNVRVEVPLPVSKVIRYRSGEIMTLYPARLAMAIQAGVSKAARNAIVQAIPRHISRAVYEKAKAVALETGELALPKLLEAFAAFNVQREQLEGLYQKKLEELTSEERRNLRGLFTAFREQLLDPAEYFAGAQKPSDGAGGGDEASQPEGSQPSQPTRSNGVTSPPSATAGEATVTRGTVAPQRPTTDADDGAAAAHEGASRPAGPANEEVSKGGETREKPAEPEKQPTQADLEGLGI